jgi:hypothetical protein
MSYDIRNLHIAEDSPEGHVISAVMARDHVTPEEAVRSILRRAYPAGREITPAEEMIGALSDPESVALLDEVVAEAYRARSQDQLRDFGL